MKHHGDFECPLCKRNFNDAVELALHEKTHAQIKDKYFSCTRCINTKFCMSFWEQAYLKHFLECHLHLPWQTLICQICQMGFVGKNNSHLSKLITRHNNVCHDMSKMCPENISRCTECPAYFKTSTQLQIHLEEIHTIKPGMICPECGKKFPKTRLLNLQQHMISVHKYDQSNYPFAFREPTCTRRFTVEESMELHFQRVHAATKVVSKQMCPLSKRDILNSAFKKHTSICGKPAKRLHVCETCGKAFPAKERLARHRLTHSTRNEWEFCCETCGKKCSTKQKLDEHTRTHTKEKPFQCSYCDEKYAHRHNLRAHVNRKHGDLTQDIARKFDKTNLSSRKGIPM